MAKNNMETLGAHPKYQKVQVPWTLAGSSVAWEVFGILALHWGRDCWMLQQSPRIRTYCR